MKFFKSKKELFIFCLLTLVLCVCTKLSLLKDLRLSLDAIFSGLLALTGFVLTARTFITFKLNEVIYESPKYRNRVEKLKKDGAYHKELYDPLKNMDRRLGRATYMCLTSVALFAILSFLPDKKEIILQNSISYNTLFSLFRNHDAAVLFMKSPSAYPTVMIKLFSSATLIYFLLCFYHIVNAAIKLNKSIKEIISYWEDEYNKDKSED